VPGRRRERGFSVSARAVGLSTILEVFAEASTSPRTNSKQSYSDAWLATGSSATTKCLHPHEPGQLLAGYRPQP
jgi:hypothetical protein